MWLSKSNRIILLLIIDSAFFLLELTVGKDLRNMLVSVRKGIADLFARG